MKVNFLNLAKFDDLRRLSSEELLSCLRDNVFIVQNYLSTLEVAEIRRVCCDMAKDTQDSWHPCIDGAPDYHRVVNNYPKAHVKSIQHGFYFHPWNNGPLDFLKFKELFEWKISLGGFSYEEFEKVLSNIPSDGVIARLVCHHYPLGGGGQNKHIDPTSDYAKVQTLLMLSQRGVDYKTGGLYVEHPKSGRIDIDPLTTSGDLILISPELHHGVEGVNKGTELDWDLSKGRWILIPLMLESDHIRHAIRPKEVK